jgi:molybdopterin synthase catalytic subunit
MFTLSTEPLEPAALRARLDDPRAGGCVEFAGVVRNENDGRGVIRLEYEGYEAVARKEGEAVLREAMDKFAILRAECAHRVGTLEIGDVAVWVGVSAAHRGAAFDACRYIIDEIKLRLPIWKKEHYREGDSGWVNCQTAAPRARQ